MSLERKKTGTPRAPRAPKRVAHDTRRGLGWIWGLLVWLGAALCVRALPMLQIIHNWPDAPDAQDALIRRLQERGFGGVVCNVSFDHYLQSEEKWAAFVRAVQQARQAGMTMWLYDERGYPSGNAGGLVLKQHPEWEAQGLLVSRAECGPGAMELAVPPGRLYLAAAYPLAEGQAHAAGRIDLASRVQGNRLNWEAPAGRWLVLAVGESNLYEGTHAEGNLAEKMPYVNLLRSEPTDAFLELTHRAYGRRLSPNLGKYFEASFTDEPSLMSAYLRPMPWRPLPWAPELPQEFRRRRGYPLDERVVLALVTEAGPLTAKHRHDYWLTVGELVSENFFGRIQRECRRLHFPSGGHLLMEEGVVAQVPLYGDFFRCARRLDAPGIDCLTSVPAEVPWRIARLMASVADLEQRRYVMCEASDHSQVYRPAGDTRPKRIVTEAEMRGTCNRLMVAGINRITSYYRYHDIPVDSLRRLNAWIDRCTAALEGGHQVADLALLYPVESLWTKFTPARHWANESPAATRIENLYHATAESLFAAQREFTVVDSRALQTARVRGDSLLHGDLSWRVVVLPGIDTLPLKAWENLARFVRRGGVVIALGALPTNSDTEFPSPRVQKWGREMFGEPAGGPRVAANEAGGAGIFLPSGSESLLPVVLRGVLEPDVRVLPARSPLRVTHRRIGTQEVYFAINDSPDPWQGELRLATAGSGMRINPATGERTSLAGGDLTPHLEGYGAALFMFDRARRPARLRLNSGGLPNLAVRDLPACVPTAAGGEFVRARVESDPAPPAPGRSVWRCSAELTRGNVDTFLFAVFHPERPLDFSGADCLALRSWVPPGQQTPSQLLAILHEEGGGDFLAATGRSLAAEGVESSFLTWDQFHLAGWSKDADGRLDLRKISEIRVGWGGYLGAAGERVVFSCGAPQLGSIASGTTP